MTLKVKKKNEVESMPSPHGHAQKPTHILTVKQLTRFLTSYLSPSSPSLISCSCNTSPRPHTSTHHCFSSSSSKQYAPCPIHTNSTTFPRTPFTMPRSASSPSSSSSSRTAMYISSTANTNADKDDSVAECIRFMKKSASPATEKRLYLCTRVES